MAYVINKSAASPVTDPSWERYLSVHAAAARGDAAAMSDWAAIELADPGAARIVPEYARLRRPDVTKARSGYADEADDDTFEDYEEFKASAGHGQLSKSAGSHGRPVDLSWVDRDPEFAAFVGKAQATGTLNKSIGSQPTPTSLAALDGDPEFAAFVASVGRARRHGAVPPAPTFTGGF